MSATQSTHTDCARIRALVDRYVSNETTREESRDLEAHIAHCSECAERVRAVESLKQMTRRAVAAEHAPDALRQKILRSVNESDASPQRRAHFIPIWAYGIAASIVLLVTAWFLLRDPGEVERPGPPGKSELADDVTGRMTDILRIGLVDHINCAVKSGYADKELTFEQMTQQMGPAYKGLVPLVRTELEGYRVTVAHQCSFGGRRFVHMILKKPGGVISIAITRRTPADSIPAGASARSRPGGVALYRAKIDDYEVAGFATEEFLAFTVSNLDEREHTRVTETLTPPIAGFLGQVEVQQAELVVPRRVAVRGRNVEGSM